MHAAPPYDDPFHESRQPSAPLVVIAVSGDQRRAQLQELLWGSGFDVVLLETGAQLLQYLYNSVAHEARPDLVICDAELDGIDGAQVCKISRAQDTLLPFIVLARPGTPGDFDSLELSDDACVLPADVEPRALKAAVLQQVEVPDERESLQATP